MKLFRRYPSIIDHCARSQMSCLNETLRQANPRTHEREAVKRVVQLFYILGVQGNTKVR